MNAKAMKLITAWAALALVTSPTASFAERPWTLYYDAGGGNFVRERSYDRETDCKRRAGDVANSGRATYCQQDLRYGLVEHRGFLGWVRTSDGPYDTLLDCEARVSYYRGLNRRAPCQAE